MKPSDKEDYVKYRLKRAHESLQEAEDLLRLGHEFGTVNRLYYACYYAVNALLYQKNISNAVTHSGVQRMLGLHFVETGKLSRDMGRFYSDLFNQRHKGDYDDFVEFETEFVEEMLANSKKFIKEVETLIK